MEFIKDEVFLYWWIFPAALTVILIWIAIRCDDKYMKAEKGSRSEKVSILLTWIAGLTAFIAFIAAIALAITQYNLKWTETFDARTNLINEVYGFQISQNDYEALKFPSEKPSASTEIFGAFEKAYVTETDELKTAQVRLAWVDGEFRLFEAKDGNSLGNELPRKEE